MSGLMGKAIVIGEVGLAHEGSMGIALSYVDALASAGADFVKFQIHFPEVESSFAEKFRVRGTSQDKTRYDYWARTSFTSKQWHEIKEHCDAVGIKFLATPFSVKAFELLQDLGCDSVKIGSGDFTNPELLERAASLEGSVFASCGMATSTEIRDVVNQMKQGSAEFVLMQCTSMYPTPPNRVNARQINSLRSDFGVAVGFSDHTGTVNAGLHALSMGAAALEVHACFDKSMYGIDASASLVMKDIELLVRHAKLIEEFNTWTEKDQIALELADYREMFGRSLGLIRDFDEGDKPELRDFVLRKPGGGLEWSDRLSLIGKPLKRKVGHLDLLSREDFSL